MYMEMKRLHETFTDEEWEELKEIKDASKLPWHDFILECARQYKKD